MTQDEMQAAVLGKIEDLGKRVEALQASVRSGELLGERLSAKFDAAVEELRRIAVQLDGGKDSLRSIVSENSQRIRIVEADLRRVEKSLEAAAMRASALWQQLLVKWLPWLVLAALGAWIAQQKGGAP